jgi:transcription elongation factor Elf1
MGLVKAKPCPFCGSENICRMTDADKYRHHGLYSCYIECIDCYCRGPEVETKTDILSAENINEIVNKWNNRAQNQC